MGAHNHVNRHLCFIWSASRTLAVRTPSSRRFGYFPLYTPNKEADMRKTKTGLGQEQIEAGADVLRALTHPLRMRILKFIDESGTINVNKIYSSLQLEQSITSQHLRILRVAGLVDTQREGKYIHYSINYDKVGRALTAVREFSEEDEG